MEHITNVLVYSNRCEVLDSHVFTVGDRGFPHIRLKFIYMFGAETLQGKQLELKYILPDKSYQVENINVTEKDEVLFPIHYSVFVNGGWTTLKITIVESANRITLDDIIIKTKKLEAEQEFQHKDVKAIVQTEITKISKKIKEFEEETKTELNTLKSNLSQNLETEKNSNIEALKEAYNNEIKKLDGDVKKVVTKYLKENTDTFNGEIVKLTDILKGVTGGKVNLNFIQDPGEKRIGEYYLDKNTGKLFRCIRTTSSIVNSSEYFKDMSIDSIVNRLENLFNFEYKENWETITGCVSMTSQIIKLSGIMIQINTYNFDRIINKTRLTFPVTFKGAPFVTVTDNDFSLTESSSNYRIGWSTNNYVDVYGLNAGFMIFAIGRI
ncbi:hypothetical protein O3799_00670 [Fusobacterium periodonticum]|uniref:hypothetical protein n=1 Tax=Fusobacterium periodonticum TaxID=860 RepID=UPI00352D06D9